MNVNVKQIKELAQIVSQNGLTRLRIAEGDLEIVMEREAVVVQAAPIEAAPVVVAAPAAAEKPAAPALPAGLEPGVDFNDIVEIKSPMVGVYYAAPAPDAEPFVKVGSQVKKGDVLCIVEAMKLMNEITAEQDGKIADICVQNADVVEFGQTLFKLY